MTEQLVDVTALAAENLAAQVELKAGDELRFMAGAQRFYLPWTTPELLDWAWDARQELMVRLLELGVHTEPVGPLEPEIDEAGVGRTYRLELVRLRVIGIEDGPVMAGAIPGAEPEVLEAGMLRVVVIGVAALAALVGGGLVGFERVLVRMREVAEVVPPQAFTRAAGAAQLVGWALAIAAGAWALREARQW